ncbi:MAG: RNB domain-containing ribonuclease [Synechococcus sp.]
MIDLLGITIDGESSKDLDDAVWVVDEGEQLRLWISIAAVSNSVAPFSDPMQHALVWLESRYRGSRCTQPMLSAELTEAHSLLPLKERPAIALQILLQPDGTICDYSFHRARLASQARFSYEQADRILAGTETSQFADQLQMLSKAAMWLDRGRQGIWGKAVVGEFRNDIGQVVSGSHQLIASTAIAYNALAAKTLSKAKMPGMYRVQDVLKVEDIKELVQKMGDDPQVLAPLISHCLPRAEHRPKVGPHWALKLSGYARTSSPLRRVEDLINQQQLVAAMDRGKSVWNPLILKGLCERIADRVVAYEAMQREKTIARREKTLQTPIALTNLTSNQFSGLLEQAAESGDASVPLLEQLHCWMAEDKFTPRHAAVVMNGKFEAEVKDRVLGAVLENQPMLNSISVINSMGQLGFGEATYRYSGEGTEWQCQLVWQEHSAFGLGQSKSTARTMAANEMMKVISNTSNPAGKCF